MVVEAMLRNVLRDPRHEFGENLHTAWVDVHPMNLHLLLEAIARHTTVLIAHLAPVAGARATLAGTAGQVFVSLVTEQKQQGLSNKVIADMFGLALRTYHNRLQRLTESKSFRGRGQG